MANTDKDIDQHIQKIISIHFDEKNGTPYWIRKAQELNLNPIKEIRSFSDLQKLGFLDEDILRTIPVEDFIPKSQLNFEKYLPHVYETGGSSGIPKKVIDTSHQIENAHWVCEILKLHGFKDKGNWLNFFPSGPHAVSLLTYHISHHRNELCYFIDIDPRWVKRCISGQKEDTLDLYIEHLMEQAVNVLNSQKITYLFITPKLLEKLICKIDLIQAGIKGIICGGTQINTEFHKLLKTEIAPGVDFCALYGNTLMGVAPQLPRQLYENQEDWSVRYYGYYPHFVLQLVEEDNPDKVVEYNQEGVVKLTVLNHDIFIPALLERDKGIRIPPVGMFSWDGIANVGIRSSKQDVVIEGVY